MLPAGVKYDPLSVLTGGVWRNEPVCAAAGLLVGLVTVGQQREIVKGDRALGPSPTASDYYPTGSIPRSPFVSISCLHCAATDRGRQSRRLPADTLHSHPHVIHEDNTQTRPHGQMFYPDQCKPMSHSTAWFRAILSHLS